MPEGDFALALMEDLPWTDGAFDVVTGFNSFQYALDVPGALAEAARVSRSLLAVCKYGDPLENEFFAFLAAAAPDRFGLTRLPARDDVDRALDHFDVRESGVVATALTFADDRELAAAVDLPIEAAAPYRPVRRQLPVRAAAQVPHHRIAIPPSTLSTWPVTKLEPRPSR